jgi:hypothetical protein
MITATDSDGWMTEDIFKVTATPPVSVTGQNFSVDINQSVPISSYFTVGNPYGDSITKYALFDAGGSKGHFTVGGVAEPNGSWFYVNASDLNSVDFVGGHSAGVDQTLYVKAYDATVGVWSVKSSFIVETVGIVSVSGEL